jgi:hypothetical protein
VVAGFGVSAGVGFEVGVVEEIGAGEDLAGEREAAEGGSAGDVVGAAELETIEAEAVDAEQAGGGADGELDFVGGAFGEFGGDEAAGAGAGGEDGALVMAAVIVGEGEDFGEFVVEEEADEVEVVDADFDEGATAGVAAGFPGGDAVVGAGAVPGEADGLDGSEGAGAEDVAGVADEAVEAHVEAGDGGEAGGVGVVEETLAGGDVKGKRFFDVDGAAGVEGGDGQVNVGFGRGEDTDDVEVIEGEQVGGIGDGAGDVELGGAGAGGIEVTEGGDLGGGDAAEGGEVFGAGDFAATDEADFEGWRVMRAGRSKHGNPPGVRPLQWREDSVQHENSNYRLAHDRQVIPIHHSDRGS